MSEPELSDALRSGDPETIRAALDAGADVRYVRPHGYTALIDVMYGRSLTDDPHLLAVLRLLIDRGAGLYDVSDYGESALSVASRVGRFDAVGLLLAAGAHPDPLGCTALHLAVALGAVADIRPLLDGGADLSDRDGWERTPWLLAVQTGDVGTAELLLAAGADPGDRGRCGKTPLQFAVERNDPAMLRWLLGIGIDPNGTDDFGETALVEAARGGSVECVRLLLDAGADVHLAGQIDHPIRAADSLEVARILVRAGADPADMNGNVRAELTGQPRSGVIECSPEEYQAAKRRVFGVANPQLMNVPFWRAMVRAGSCAYAARERFEGGRCDWEAVWCFDRFGMSLTELPDGRVIEIGGEHEDSYDPDFCIYNDVVVHRGNGTFDLYGYPKAVFPPTDFHTATLVGNTIYVIGSLGYAGERRYGTTPVFRLDTDSLAITAVETRGEPPGWICRHKARLVGRTIEVSGGKVCGWVDGAETYEDRRGRYALDLDTTTWTRVG